MKLFVTQNIPYPDNDGGRKLTLGRILDASKNESVIVLSYNYNYDKYIEAVNFFKKNNILFSVFESKRKYKYNKFTAYVISFFTKKPYFAFHINEKDFINFINSIIKKYNINAISFESIFFLNMLNKLDISDKNIEFVLHNVESEYLKELSKNYSNIILKALFFIESIKTKKYEKKLSTLLCNKNIFSVVLTKDDKKKYIDKFRFLENKIIMNKNHIYIDKKLKHRKSILNEYFLFPGSLTFPPNLYGIKWLLDEYEKSNIDIPIYITGKITDKIKNDFLKYKKVKLLGFVSSKELNDLFEKCICVISPIISGGGIKIKNIESIEKGIPIIMTEFSAIGTSNLDGNKIVVSNSKKEFCKKMIEIYNEK